MKKHIEDTASKARADLAKYVVAVQTNVTCRAARDRGKGISGSWVPTGHRGMEVIHAEYDSGYVDLVQQRVGEGAFVLCAIPRKTRAVIRDDGKFALTPVG